MANYVENFPSKMDWQMPFNRVGAFPLDRTNLFSSYDDAVLYATGGADSRGLSGTSYIGQILVVYENDAVAAYMIGADRVLIKLAQTSASGDLAGDVATLQGQVSALQTKDTELEEAIAAIEEAYAAADEALQGEVDGLKGRMDTAEGKITTLEGKITGVFHYKGIAPDGQLANVTDPQVGDVYLVGDREYVYNGTSWDELGYTTDLSAYSTTTEMNEAIATAKGEATDYADSLATNYDAAGSAAAVLGDAEDTAEDYTVYGAFANANTKASAINTEIENLKTADTNLQTNIDAKLAKSDFESFKTTNTAAIDAVDDKADANATAIANLQTADVTLQNNIDAKVAQSEYDAKVSALETADTTNATAAATAQAAAEAAQATADKAVVANGAITASGDNYHIVQYDAKGLVVAGKALAASDIPTIEQNQVNGLPTTISNINDSLAEKATKTEMSNADAALLGTVDDASTAETIRGARKLANEAIAQGNANATEIAKKLDASAVTGDLLTHNAAEFATAAQGAKADSAIQSVVTGATNGTISVDGEEVAVAGLGSAAYTNSSAYDAAGTATALIDALDATHTATVGSYISGITQVDGKITAVAETALPAAVVYSIAKDESSSDYAAVYHLTADGVNTGAAINIPKDMVVQSGSVVTDPEGQAAGTYIELVLQNVEKPLYINVGNLIEYVTSGSATGDMVVVNVSDDHKVTASITDGTVTLAKLDAAVQTEINKAHTHAAGMKEIVTVSGDLTFASGELSYSHPTTTATGAAFVKVGNDDKGHVVIGDAVAKTDITGLLDAGDGTYDAIGSAAQALVDAKAYADTAESDAIAAANAYAEGLLTWGEF